jgi:hypothetical protein
LERSWLKKNKVSILKCDDGCTWLKVGNIGKFFVKNNKWMKENAGNLSYNNIWNKEDGRDREFDVAMVTVGNVSVEGYKGGQ